MQLPCRQVIASVAWVTAAVACMVMTVWIAAELGKPKEVVLAAPSIGGPGDQNDLSIDRIRDDLAVLTATPCRMTGSPGARAAADHILAVMEGIGATTETYPVRVPVPATETCFLRCSRPWVGPVCSSASICRPDPTSSGPSALDIFACRRSTN